MVTASMNARSCYSMLSPAIDLQPLMVADHSFGGAAYVCQVANNRRSRSLLVPTLCDGMLTPTTAVLAGRQRLVGWNCYALVRNVCDGSGFRDDYLTWLQIFTTICDSGCSIALVGVVGVVSLSYTRIDVCAFGPSAVSRRRHQR